MYRSLFSATAFALAVLTCIDLSTRTAWADTSSEDLALRRRQLEREYQRQLQDLDRQRGMIIDGIQKNGEAQAEVNKQIRELQEQANKIVADEKRGRDAVRGNNKNGANFSYTNALTADGFSNNLDDPKVKNRPIADLFRKFKNLRFAAAVVGNLTESFVALPEGEPPPPAKAAERERYMARRTQETTNFKQGIPRTLNRLGFAQAPADSMSDAFEQYTLCVTKNPNNPATNKAAYDQFETNKAAACNPNI
jgi:hypothetical protein